MADINKSIVDDQNMPSGSAGKIMRQVFGQSVPAQSASIADLAAAALNDVIYCARVPKHVRVDDMVEIHDALGATNGLAFKLINISDGADVTGGAILTVADASTAARSVPNAAYHPIFLTEDAYLVATKTGAGTATGTVSGWIDYEFIGNL